MPLRSAAGYSEGRGGLHRVHGAVQTGGEQKADAGKVQGFRLRVFDARTLSVLRALDTELHAATDGNEEVADEKAKEWEDGIDASRAAYAIGDFKGAVESAERVLESSDGCFATDTFYGSRPDWPP